VLAQLSGEVKVVRRVPPTVFHPAPKVESAIVRLRRTGPPPTKDVVDLVHAGFAHRRKALPRALSLAPGAAPGVREVARAALERLGHPADERAEKLRPEEFTRLAKELQ
jgi:16S rRNA (adenine1518-N6/adenine1519-N6)-dimethyltransferase